MKDGSAFVEGVSEKNKQEAIEYEMTVKQPYRDNRSRYFLKKMVNGKQDKEFLTDADTLTTECTCYLSNDTIKVNMGIWVFGGLGANILIMDKKYSSAFWEDVHKQKIFKTTLNQKELSDNVFVENASQQLILKASPQFSVGENIEGYLKFKTSDYFVSADYEPGFGADSYSDAEMYPVYVQGDIYFKCRLRKKTWADE